MTFDLLPWETAPQTPEQTVETIEWNGGTIKLPRLGYLMVDELNAIRAVDPQNALYRLTADTAVALSRAAAEQEQSPRQCFALLTALHGRELGAAVRLTPEQEAMQIQHAATIAPFLEQARAITNRVVIRAVTVIIQRVRPDWSDDQTRRLPGELLSRLHAFEQEEERAGAGEEDAAAQMRALEDALGKLQQVVSTATDPTGDRPTGNAAASGPAPPSSVVSASGASPAATSSRPSKRATGQNGKRSTARS